MSPPRAAGMPQDRTAHASDGRHCTPLCFRRQFAPAPIEFSSLDEVGAPARGQAQGPQKPPVSSAAAAEPAAMCPWRADGPAARPAEGGHGRRAPFTGHQHSHDPGSAAVWAARMCPAWERASLRVGEGRRSVPGPPLLPTHRLGSPGTRQGAAGAAASQTPTRGVGGPGPGFGAPFVLCFPP